jgi:hypothetical protein
MRLLQVGHDELWQLYVGQFRALVVGECTPSLETTGDRFLVQYELVSDDDGNMCRDLTVKHTFNLKSNKFGSVQTQGHAVE